VSSFAKFELRAPHPQNAVDIFQGHWASDLAKVMPGLTAGDADLFVNDTRPKLAAEKLGRTPGHLDGMHILELGPLEGGHTYQLERLGAASIVAVEANVEAYLKCLVVKELLDLKRTRFVLGDMMELLARDGTRYDLIFASGVLYHMSDPLRLLELIAQRSDRCFLWTHYFDAEHYTGPVRAARAVGFRDLQVTYHEMEYSDMDYEKFWGGNRPKNVWLPKRDLLQALAALGYSRIEILRDEPEHANGAAITLAASRAA
jgi:hypothetical protein